MRARKSTPTPAAALVDHPTPFAFHSPSANTARYSGVFDCAVQTAREGGVAAFYKGFTSNFARLGAFNVALFLALEQARAAMRKL